jgi:2-C-methyl-D-erythritol 4-phosphate cytidylyltransferase
MSQIAVVLVTAVPDLGQPQGALVKVDGRESVLRCMEMFTNREGVAQIMVTIDASQAEDAKRKIGSHLMFMGVKLVSSTPMWWQQLADAQKQLKPEVTHVLVHDAARPAVSYVDLDALTSLADKHPAVALARPVEGTLATASSLPGPGTIGADVKLAQVLAPQLFTRDAFAAMVSAKKLPAPLHLIEGSPLNVRCGTHDAGLVKAMINLLPKPKMKAASSPFEEAQW